MAMRKKFEPALKARIALEAIRGEKTLAEISSEYGAHATQISKWKQELIAGSAEIFSNGKTLKDTGHQEQIDKLHRVIGEITVERDWLKKKLNLLI